MRGARAHVLAAQVTSESLEVEGLAWHKAVKLAQGQHAGRQAAVVDLVSQARVRHRQLPLGDVGGDIGRLDQIVVARVVAGDHVARDRDGLAVAGVLGVEVTLRTRLPQGHNIRTEDADVSSLERGCGRSVVGLVVRRHVRDRQVGLRDDRRRRTGSIDGRSLDANSTDGQRPTDDERHGLSSS